jgi:hypothetical protein
MGQAKYKREQEKRNEGGFAQRLQNDASDVVKAAQYLVDNEVATWQALVMPNGTTSIALLFKSSLWELKDHKLTLKVPQREGE